MKLEEGMYVRTINDKAVGNGIIGKIKYINERTFKGKLRKYYSVWTNNEDWFEILENDVVYERIKASFNIIDLIKPKDIILGNDGKLYQCWKVYKDYVFTYSKNKQGQTITLVDYQIDRVMCYEQFESMSYKVVEE